MKNFWKTLLFSGTALAGISQINTQAIAAIGAQTLPNLPMPAGTPVIKIGDSIIAYQDEISAVTPTLAADNLDKGEFQWVYDQDPRFNNFTYFDSSSLQGNNLSGSNLGVFGDHFYPVNGLLGIIPRLNTALANSLAYNNAIVVLEGGSNSISSGENAPYGSPNTPSTCLFIETQLDLGLRSILAAHKWAMLFDIIPRGDWPVGGTQQSIRTCVNTWVTGQIGRVGVKVVQRSSVFTNVDGTQAIFNYENEDQTTLSAAIDAQTTTVSIPVVNRTAFPQSGPFCIRVEQEEMLVTAGWGNGAGVFTVTRCIESSSCVAHVSGAYVGGGFIHPNRYGAYLSAQIIDPILDTMIASGTVYNPDPLVSNLYTANPGMTGSQSAVSNGVIGVEPSGFTATLARTPTAWVGTGTIAGTTFTISTSTSGTFLVGGSLSGTGVTGGTTVQSLLSGTVGAVGSTYNVSTASTTSGTPTITENFSLVTSAVSAIDGSHGMITLTLNPPGNLLGAGLGGITPTFGEIIVGPTDLVNTAPAVGTWLLFCANATVSNTFNITNLRAVLNTDSPGTTVVGSSYGHNNFSSSFWGGSQQPGIGNITYEVCTDPMKIPAAFNPASSRLKTQILIFYPYTATDVPTVSLSGWFLRTVTDPSLLYNLNAPTP